ncbi:MAG: hypothetical protein NTV49_07830 [Kiritimatiellaeota bacterium]|nr:hypothetical protein [Kiritimatiellota bacterium]
MLVLPLRDLVLAHPKAGGDRHPVLRTFAGSTTPFLRGRAAHQKFARRNPHQIHLHVATQVHGDRLLTMGAGAGLVVVECECGRQPEEIRALLTSYAACLCQAAGESAWVMDSRYMIVKLNGSDENTAGSLARDLTTLAQRILAEPNTVAYKAVLHESWDDAARAIYGEKAFPPEPEAAPAAPDPASAQMAAAPG